MSLMGTLAKVAIGVAVAKGASSLANSASVVRCIGVSIMPGATLFTSTPCGASAAAPERVSESTPALLAA